MTSRWCSAQIQAEIAGSSEPKKVKQARRSVMAVETVKKADAVDQCLETRIDDRAEGFRRSSTRYPEGED